MEKNKEAFPLIHHKKQVYLRCLDCLSKIPLDKIYTRDRGICGICGKVVHISKASIDHIVPISKGGAHDFSNVQLAHLKCNLKKGSRSMEEYENTME